MTFGDLQIGARFRMEHLSQPMIKVRAKRSDRCEGTKPFVGMYNAVAQGGGRWIFKDDREVLK